jgi:hypothetical protein
MLRSQVQRRRKSLNPRTKLLGIFVCSKRSCGTKRDSLGETVRSNVRVERPGTNPASAPQAHDFSARLRRARSSPSRPLQRIVRRHSCLNSSSENKDHQGKVNVGNSVVNDEADSVCTATNREISGKVLERRVYGGNGPRNSEDAYRILRLREHGDSTRHNSKLWQIEGD